MLRRIRDDDQADVPSVRNELRAGPETAPTARLIQDRLSSEDVAALITDFQGGTAKHVLAARFGISETTVKRLLRVHGVRATWGLEERLSASDVRRLIVQYRNGASVTDLVARFGGSSSSVRRLLQRYGIRR